ncbi:SCO2583 family membrane protein [Streptomyces sp. NPDC003691]
MAGRGDPPEGVPEGLPGGGEDEYGAVVFDESFVRAARLQEYSARERTGPDARAVRTLPSPGSGARRGARGAWVVMALALLLAVSVATAIHIGLRRSPGAPVTGARAEPLRMTVVPLAPSGAVPGGEPAALYHRSQAARHRIAASGIALPAIRRTSGFSESEVRTALWVAKEYLVMSSLNPSVLSGGTVRPVRVLLDPGQLDAFDRDVGFRIGARPSASGWLIRFDPAKAVLADPAVRVRGSLEYAESGTGSLEITSSHTFTYALRPAAPPGASRAPSAPAVADPGRRDPASLFVARRELRLRFDHEDILRHRTELVTSHLQAGPQSCSAEPAGALRPLLAGERAAPPAPAGTDPYATATAPAAGLCGSLSPAAQPTPETAPRGPRPPPSG